jgi:hypothetical protein
MRPSLVVASSLVFVWPALAVEPGIHIRRGDDTLVYGNCVPSLAVENRSNETIGYLEVDLLLTLAGGEDRIVELKSAYREGILYPIRPGWDAVLRQHLDTSRALGVACDAIRSRRVARVICELPGGKACTAPVSVQP